MYFKEYVKVEAILDPENIQKFIIPIDVPYTGPSSARMNKRSKQFKNPTTTPVIKPPPQQPTIGKIRMRKIAEMQRVPAILSRQPRRRYLHRDLVLAPPCTCYLCRISKYYPCVRPAPAMPNNPVVAVQSRIWRPFM